VKKFTKQQVRVRSLIAPHVDALFPACVNCA
jgi:hypothetical protein